MTTTDMSQLSRRKYRLTFDYFAGMLHYFRWWILFIVVGLIVAGVIVAQFIALDTSWWGNLLNGVKIAIAVMAAITIYESLPVFVAAGLTRKEFAIAHLASFGLIGLTVALAGSVGLVIEHFIFSAMNWVQPSPTISNEEEMANIGDVLLASSVYYISLPTVAIAGAAIGAALYRNGLLGTVVFLPIVVTVLAFDGAMYDNSIQIFGFLNIYDAPLVVGVIGSLILAPCLAWLSIKWTKDSSLHEVKM